MFDDKPVASQGQMPQNLPVGEPEDVFAGTDVTPEPNVAEAQTTPSPSAPPSALDAGILRPKEAPSSTYAPPSAPSVPPLIMTTPPASASSMNTLKEPTMSRGIMTLIIVVTAVVLLGGASWWVYRYLNVPATPPADSDFDGGKVNDDTFTPPDDLPPAETSPAPVTDSGSSPLGEATSSQPVDDELLFGEFPDTDGDGLDDNREETLKTDPKKEDSDGDELTDGDEVIIWNTDPNNPDTDGDSYVDGKEIKAGFSPKGPGKLFEVKSSSTTTIISS